MPQPVQYFLIERSTIDREVLPSSKCTPIDVWYQDDWGDWINEEGEEEALIDGMKAFYESTGIQPYLWITGEDGGQYKSSERERILMGAGFNQEAVLRDEVRTKDGFEDAGLYAMLSYEYPKYNVCFVPFERGVAVVTGGDDYIDSVRLFHYGQQLEDPFEKNVAASLGYLDSNQGLMRNDDGIYNMDAEQLKALPNELAEAYVELKEYFDSNRAGFNINVRFTVGTPFQKKVWNALNSIPHSSRESLQ